MKLSTFAVAFGLACAAIAAATLATYEPEASRPESGPALSPVAWPDHGVIGPGFVTPDLPDGALVAYGYALVSRTFATIGPEVGDPAMRFAGNKLLPELPSRRRYQPRRPAAGRRVQDLSEIPDARSARGFVAGAAERVHDALDERPQAA